MDETVKHYVCGDCAILPIECDFRSFSALKAEMGNYGSFVIGMRSVLDGSDRCVAMIAFPIDRAPQIACNILRQLGQMGFKIAGDCLSDRVSAFIMIHGDGQ
jgi:hypothetical protein